MTSSQETLVTHGAARGEPCWRCRASRWSTAAAASGSARCRRRRPHAWPAARSSGWSASRAAASRRWPGPPSAWSRWRPARSPSRDSRCTPLGRRRRPEFLRGLQMVFQDPYESLNPRRKVGEIIADGVRARRRQPRRRPAAGRRAAGARRAAGHRGRRATRTSSAAASGSGSPSPGPWRPGRPA